jgi:hypothetical protein
MKTHAFLIVAHTFPEQLEEIVNLLDASNHYFFIHVDKKNEKMLSVDALLRLKEKENVVILNPMRVSHGGYSQVAYTLKLLEESYYLENCKIDYFHVISGQDYPCMPNSDLDAIFEHDEKSYMHFDSPEETLEYKKHVYPDRINYFNFVDLHIPFLPNICRRIFIFGLNKVAKIYKRKPMIDLYGGWDWYSWHRSVVAYILKFIEDNPHYVKRFQNTIAAIEVFFHTILYDQVDQLNIEKYNALRFIQWYPRKGETLDHKIASRKNLLRPLVLDEREYDDIVHSGAIFCRKVHPVRSAKLLSLLKKRICDSAIKDTI